MAKTGTCYFDAKGGIHRCADDATKSDLAAILGKVGEGDSLAPGIAARLLEKRADIERIFAEHDAMMIRAEQSEYRGADIRELRRR